MTWSQWQRDLIKKKKKIIEKVTVFIQQSKLRIFLQRLVSLDEFYIFFLSIISTVEWDGWSVFDCLRMWLNSHISSSNNQQIKFHVKDFK